MNTGQCIRLDKHHLSDVSHWTVLKLSIECDNFRAFSAKIYGVVRLFVPRDKVRNLWAILLKTVDRMMMSMTNQFTVNDMTFSMAIFFQFLEIKTGSVIRFIRRWLLIIAFSPIFQFNRLKRDRSFVSVLTLSTIFKYTVSNYLQMNHLASWLPPLTYSLFGYFPSSLDSFNLAHFPMLFLCLSWSCFSRWFR